MTSALILQYNTHRANKSVQAASLTEWNNRLAHSRNCCCDRILLGYLATSVATSDIIFFLADPDFLQRWQNFAPMSLSFRDLMRDRQTTDSGCTTGLYRVNGVWRDYAWLFADNDIIVRCVDWRHQMRRRRTSDCDRFAPALMNLLPLLVLSSLWQGERMTVYWPIYSLVLPIAPVIIASLTRLWRSAMPLGRFWVEWKAVTVLLNSSIVHWSLQICSRWLPIFSQLFSGPYYASYSLHFKIK